ncbi:MAG: hypothetical protein M1837_000965 [Sclerophora amabilis]|nr:MAG: hypothetical protein M1837_000965 [Sclerophora amabilis]
MSLFPRFPSGEFAPLFRLMDDYDVHRSSRGSSIRAFQPKFDVREVKDAYELHGELPGINQSDVHIEFSDPHTIVVKGRTEREATSGNLPAIQGSQPAGHITADVSDQPTSSSYHKATVEEEGASTPGGATPATSTTETQQVTPSAKDQNVDKAKYWVSERSVGEFHRSFSFPSRVDQDAVKASLKNGILSVVVPKAAAHQSRRIAIE